MKNCILIAFFNHVTYLSCWALASLDSLFKFSVMKTFGWAMYKSCNGNMKIVCGIVICAISTQNINKESNLNIKKPGLSFTSGKHHYWFKVLLAPLTMLFSGASCERKKSSWPWYKSSKPYVLTNTWHPMLIRFGVYRIHPGSIEIL